MENVSKIIKSGFLEEKAKCECIYITHAPKLNLNFVINANSFATKDLIQIGVSSLLKNSTYEDMYINIMHMAIHESFHYICSNFFKLKKFIDIMKSKIKSTHKNNPFSDSQLDYLIATTLNCIEDGRIEHIASKTSPRYKYFITKSNNFIWDKRDIYTEKKSEYDDYFHTLVSLSVSNSLPKNFDKKYNQDDEIYKLFNKLYPLIRKGVKSKSFSNCLRVTEMIINESIDYLSSIFDNSNNNNVEYEFTLSPSGNSEFKLSPDNDDGNGNDNSSDNNDNDNDSNNIIPKSPTSTNDESHTDALNDNKKSITINIEKIINSELKKFIKDFTNEIKKKEEELQQREQIRPINILEMQDIYKEYNHSFEFHNTFEISHTLDANYKAEGKQLRNVFEEEIRKQKKSPSRRKKSGILNSSDLHRVFLGKEDVFKKRKPKTQDIAFEIILDMSGSMHGEKYSQATKALSILEYALAGLYPTKIIGFNTDSNCTHYYLIRDFKDTTKTINYSYNFSKEVDPDNANRDGVILAVSAKELSKRKEKQKVLIVLSDGSPNSYCCSGQSAIEELKDSVKKAYSLGITAIIPIYFGPLTQDYQNLFREMYLNRNIIFCEENEITQMLKKLLKSYLLK